MVSYPIPVTTISTPFLFFFLQQHFYSFPLVFHHLTLLPSKITYPHHSLAITPQLHIFYIWPFLPLYSVSRSLSYYTTALLSSSILHYFAVMPCGLYYASTLLLPTFFYFYTSPLCCYAVIVKGSVLRYYFYTSPYFTTHAFSAKVTLLLFTKSQSCQSQTCLVVMHRCLCSTIGSGFLTVLVRWEETNT